MLENKEVRFEQDIEDSLSTSGGWEAKKFNELKYDGATGLDLDQLISFVKETQHRQWERYQKIYQAKSEEKFLKRFNESVEMQGILHVLRNGFKDRSILFKVMYFKPVSGLNASTIEKYNANRFYCVRQFAYDKYKSRSPKEIDIVLMINGIPLVALELKNQYTGQTVDNAKIQFQNDRDAREQAFKFNRRFLVFFAVDHYDVAMTTKLATKKTYFLPFNQGSNGSGNVGGKGNPSNENGYPTSYLWEEVLTADNLMEIIQRFMNLEEEKGILIFPRYHQLDVVKKLIADVKESGSGSNYLIQHSAGSGKSNSIAWLAYHLSSVHDVLDNPIFSSIIIVTDRTVLDRQLQKTITSFDHNDGLVEVIDEKKNSQDLKNALNDGKKIIITTLQKFPIIYDQVDDVEDRKFAVIVDEAHTSQTGNSAQKLKSALSDKRASLEEYQEIETDLENGEVDGQDQLVQTLISQGRHKNISFFAFTATPKPKTIDMFGTLQEDGKEKKPFHVYSMRQAIDEGFILDVLKNYMTYKTSYQLAKQIEENPELPTTEAVRAIGRYQSFHPWVLRQKTEIMVEQFRNVTKRAINGKGKAMLVTSSRLHAVRYMQEFKSYIKEKGYKDLNVLVAFSGKVTDEDGIEYTEPSLNIDKAGNRIKESQLKEAFNSEDFNVLIVAEKYQTGFDEPLLHTMFVDKRLSGVKAVQTLSRLNRTTQGKKDTFILDFVNKGDDILEAFQPFYEVTRLDEEININLIYDTQIKLAKFNVYNQADIDTVIEIVKQVQVKQDSRLLGRLSSQFKPVITRYEELEDDIQYEFRVTLRNFSKWYDYISQIDRTFDMGLLEENIFVNFLLSFIPKEKREKVNIKDKISLEYYKLEEDFQGEINLVAEDPDSGMLTSQKEINAAVKTLEEKTPLDDIIFKVNELFPNDFTDSDRVLLEELYLFFMNEPDQKVVSMAKNNDAQMFEKTLFKDVFENRIMEKYRSNQSAYEKLFSKEDDKYFNLVYTLVAKSLYKVLRGTENNE
ncbi:restriction endonuclease subunit R [Carnobacterium maltaromaticum]|uniref:type I restriction endonuclease subunit R n=1 Tax=Carnobacterium maltaromaticum TaxID=2751 RepID=UPI00107221C3|nr:type I restriction endonuclease [Carnobacterium maltaromaticum]MDT1945383.1 type I restriction endonuclease [Carnobacterium maltaromaticum]MDT1999754.1 type I restriction endonuclease [Carnobacterium maltaromaticum]TFJ32371.1 restriction endonuclease subunit R [Carnobacterium maltaromaticum]TFJ35721.1 restriction endonuclease subunit R [Carnobacterium maltaromaticum]TFJ39539.1 restriction endonuclease subunit R [Carnobacterium maltaromaticum]